MNVQIAGASGFIGKNLCNYLDLHSFRVESLSLREDNWKNQISQSCHVLINLVGQAHDHKGIYTDEDYFHVNVSLTKELFKEFLRIPCFGIFIHVSSIAAIEEFSSTESELSESDKCNPLSAYGKTKRQAEEWLLSEELPFNKKLIIVRPPMVHGSGDKGNLGLLYRLITKGIPYPLSSFDNRRSFISIDNFNFFIKQIIENNQNLQSGIYHIADNESISTKDIIKIIKEVTGKRTPDIALPRFFVKAIAKVGDLLPIPLDSKRLKKMTGVLLVSNKKIKQALNIDALPYSAEEGIRRTIKSFYERSK